MISNQVSSDLQYNKVLVCSAAGITSKSYSQSRQDILWISPISNKCRLIPLLTKCTATLKLSLLHIMLFLSELFPAPTSAHYPGTNKVHTKPQCCYCPPLKKGSVRKWLLEHPHKTDLRNDTEAYKTTLITEIQQDGYNHQRLLNIERRMTLKWNNRLKKC